MDTYDWRAQPPAQDGDFFYSGPVPDGGKLTAVVQIFTTDTGNRMACIFIPPYWRGDRSRKNPTVHLAPLAQWTGEWSGPEFGLCCVSAS